jgi:hypothetical protein
MSKKYLGHYEDCNSNDPDATPDSSCNCGYHDRVDQHEQRCKSDAKARHSHSRAARRKSED